jgi:hypothetical protein
MGTLFVDKLDPQSGTSLEIGSSGDTITIPSGATITNSGTASGFGITGTPAFHVYLGSDQNSTHNVFAKIPFSTEVYDTDNAFDNSSNYRFTVPSGKAGRYVFYANAFIRRQGQSADWREALIAIYKNGSELGRAGLQFDDHLGQKIQLNVTTGDDASVGDYYEVYYLVYTADSGNQQVLGNANYTWFGGYKIS